MDPVRSQLVKVNDHGKRYMCLKFCCPGCAAGGPSEYEGLHMLPVNQDSNIIGKPAWSFDGNMWYPTLSPSILTQGYTRCHSFLQHGVFKFLPDCGHPLVGQHVPMPVLPEWAVEMN